MKKQFEKEAHVRNDKAKKPDYREELALDGDNYNRGGVEHRPRPPRITVGKITGNTVTVTVRRDPTEKMPEQRFLEHALIREGLFKIHGYESKIRWGLEKFSVHNNLRGPGASDIYQEVAAGLEIQYKATLRHLLFEATREIKESKGKQKYSYSFRSPLVPAKPLMLEAKNFFLDIDFFNASSAETPPPHQEQATGNPPSQEPV